MADDEEPPEPSPPPSYSVARVKDALSQIADLRNVIFVLDEDNVRLDHQNDAIYRLDHNPQLSRSETFAFAIQTYRSRQNDHIILERKRQLELYTVKETGNWLNPSLRAILPPMYTFTPEARSLFCFSSGCE